MPTYLRKFYYNKLVKAKEKEKAEIDKSRKKSSPSGISRPNIRR